MRFPLLALLLHCGAELRLRCGGSFIIVVVDAVLFPIPKVFFVVFFVVVVLVLFGFVFDVGQDQETVRVRTRIAFEICWGGISRMLRVHDHDHDRL